MNTLAARAWFGLFFLAMVMGLVLFISAGTIDYWQAWVYLGVFFSASSLITLYLMEKAPALLRRRLRAGPTAEKRASQKIAMLFASMGFIGLLVVPALDHRFGWSRVPLGTALAGDALTAVCFYITFRVYRENPFSSATIEIAPDQAVISNLRGYAEYCRKVRWRLAPGIF